MGDASVFIFLVNQAGSSENLRWRQDPRASLKKTLSTFVDQCA
jgi:hypothetical protein